MQLASLLILLSLFFVLLIKFILFASTCVENLSTAASSHSKGKYSYLLKTIRGGYEKRAKTILFLIMFACQ